MRKKRETKSGAGKLRRSDELAQGILARRTRGLTIAWAQKIVDQHAPDTAVSAVEVLSVDIGTTTRLRLAVAHNGPETLPRRWFVKLPSRSWRARCITTLSRLLQTEVRFYQKVAPAIPVAQPAVLAAQCTFGRSPTLVLADVTEAGAIPGAPGDALTAEQAALVVEQLACLHARFWNKASLDHEYGWLSGPVRRWEDRLGTALAIPLMQRGLRRAGRAVPFSLHAPALRYARHRRRAMGFLAQGPRTLVHHDCHPGNLFWKNDQPGFFDWQLVRIGEGIGDIAYFLATALEPETRRRYEDRLLAQYQQALAGHGIGALNSSQLRHRYRAHLIYPFEAMVVTLGIGGLMALPSNLELIRRAAAAVEDLDAFAVIER